MTTESQKIYEANYYKQNRERLLEKNRLHRLANPDYNKLYQARNKEAIKARQKGYSIARKAVQVPVDL